MYLLLQPIINITFIFVNLVIIFDIFTEFYCVWSEHIKLTKKAVEFNTLVKDAHTSLEFVSAKISETMEEIKEDIEKELRFTHNLTKLCSQTAELLYRLNIFEENFIESMRINDNAESTMIGTPRSINEEVMKILSITRNSQKKQEGDEKLDPEQQFDIKLLNFHNMNTA